jgi:ABC-2 type transport system permease protein
VLSIFTVSFRGLARGRRLLVVGLLLAVPALLALAYVASEPQPDGKLFAMQLFGNLVLPVLMPLTTLLFASSALGSEIEDRTLIYLTLRPVSRLAVAVGKWLAAAALSIALVEVALALMYLIAAQRTSGAPAEATADHGLAALLEAGLGGALAYAGLFLLVGVLAPRRGLLIGFVYVLAWEGLAAGLSGALATFSVRRYVQAVLDGAVGDARLAAVQPSTLSGSAAAWVLAGVCVGSIALTTARLKRLELP